MHVVLIPVLLIRALSHRRRFMQFAEPMERAYELSRKPRMVVARYSAPIPVPMRLAVILTKPSPSGHNTLMAFIRRLQPLIAKEHLFIQLGMERFEYLAQSKPEGAIEP